MENTTLTFWKRFDEMSRLRDVNLKQIADLTGLSYSTLKNQRSKLILPKTLAIVRIAEVLDTSVEYLILGKVKQRILDDPVFKTIRENELYYKTAAEMIRLPETEFSGIANMIHICFNNHYPSTNPDKAHHA